MKNGDDYKAGLILSLCGLVPVVWLALLTAPYVSGGIVEIIGNLSAAIENPFSITVCGDSVRTVLIFLLAYGMGIGVYFSTRRNYRKGAMSGFTSSLTSILSASSRASCELLLMTG